MVWLPTETADTGNNGQAGFDVSTGTLEPISLVLNKLALLLTEELVVTAWEADLTGILDGDGVIKGWGQELAVAGWEVALAGILDGNGVIKGWGQELVVAGWEVDLTGILDGDGVIKGWGHGEEDLVTPSFRLM